MINLVKREDYSSEEEYQKAYKWMLKAIEDHMKNHPEPKYNSSAREDFIKSVSKLSRICVDRTNINLTSR